MKGQGLNIVDVCQPSFHTSPAHCTCAAGRALSQLAATASMAEVDTAPAIDDSLPPAIGACPAAYEDPAPDATESADLTTAAPGGAAIESADGDAMGATTTASAAPQAPPGSLIKRTGRRGGSVSRAAASETSSPERSETSKTWNKFGQAEAHGRTKVAVRPYSKEERTKLSQWQEERRCAATHTSTACSCLRAGDAACTCVG